MEKEPLRIIPRKLARVLIKEPIVFTQLDFRLLWTSNYCVPFIAVSLLEEMPIEAVSCTSHHLSTTDVVVIGADPLSF